MTLNFSKIKSEADQSASENELSILKEQQIIAAVAQHKIELRELFKSLFKDHNIQPKNGGMILSVPFGGGVDVALYIPEMDKSDDGALVKLEKAVNPVFMKQKDGKNVSIISFTDATNYSNLPENNTEYQYTCKTKTETRTVKFAEIERYLQHLIDS